MDAQKRYPSISKILFEQLMAVEPSKDGALEYRPCKVFLKDGSSFDRVYVVDAESYIKVWGVWPEGDRAKRYLSIQDVTKIEESPFRIPPHLANKMYHTGESGMGYCIYTLVLNDGRKLPYLTGNAVDFPNLPPDVRPDMIVDLLPHEGRATFVGKTRAPYTTMAPHHWCLYSRTEGA